MVSTQKLRLSLTRRFPHRRPAAPSSCGYTLASLPDGLRHILGKTLRGLVPSQPLQSGKNLVASRRLKYFYPPQQATSIGRLSEGDRRLNSNLRNATSAFARPCSILHRTYLSCRLRDLACEVSATSGRKARAWQGSDVGETQSPYSAPPVSRTRKA